MTWSNWCLLVSGIVMLALTTSATGYLVGATVLVLLFGKQMLHLLVRGVIGRRILLILVIVAVALMAGLILLPNFQHVLHEVIWQKSQSRSGRDRGRNCPARTLSRRRDSGFGCRSWVKSAFRVALLYSQQYGNSWFIVVYVFAACHARA